MLESYIKNTNLVALKIFMYVAKSDKVDVELLHSLRDEQIVETRLSIKDMLNYCNISSQTLNRNLKK